MSGWPAPLGSDETQEAVVAFIKGHTSGRFGPGTALWDEVLTHAAKNGTSTATAEEALNLLMDRGLLYEPTLGVLKVI